MKQIFTLIAVLLTSLITTAQKAKLSVSITGNIATRIQVDNSRYTVNADELVLTNMAPGSHTIKIYQQRAFNGRQGSDAYTMVYNGTVNIKPQTYMDITVNRFGKTFIDEQPLNRQYGNGRDDDWGDNNWSNNNGDRDQDYYKDYQAISSRDFEQFKQAIKAESFSDTKLKMAKQFIAGNRFTSTQVKEIVQLFSFEEAKLDVAKYAYPYTVDKGNYVFVAGAFSFSSSKEELMDYIKKNP